MTNINVESDVNYDVKYGLKVDIYQDFDNVNDNRRALIDIHGGGWWLGNKEGEKSWATSFAEAGYIVFVPNYRLAPKYLYPAPIEDLVNLYDWMKQSDYQFDRNKIGAVGMSSGGNLAIELSLRTGIPIASLSGIIDLDTWIAAHPEVVASNATAPIFGTPVKKIDQTGSNNEYYKWFVLNYVNNDLALLKQASLLNRITKNAGPMFIANSMDEIVPTEGVLRLQKELTDAGVESVLQIIKGHGHGRVYANHTQAGMLAFFDDHFTD
ncbi:amidohydrolase family protein [Weissella oryzae SG25]|uniref:Amidohydrolase family protein n=1 Tax=Weissella oryzae (strain DSM 25784 / JCM 18191 / LMG 30913 / SG25) TaxID=1329250 RepID=A0A069CTN4_WEIOS|nr:alpha/beta hydrolase [Weissella oryzae]GAK30819.1 amidohydrolase family protein [Weissella oryzae SG25]